jgi:hypothetical protein
MNDGWTLVRVKRTWVPEWVWRFFCPSWVTPEWRPAAWEPLKSILTRKVEDEDYDSLPT